MNQNFELQKVRDFGELIGDTFLFAKENLKPLLKATFQIAGFFILAFMVFSVMNQLNMHGVYSDIKSNRGSSPANIFSVEYFLTLLISVLAYTAVQLVSFCYISAYRDGGNKAPSTEQVWAHFKYFFWRFLGSSILMGILLIFAVMLCFFPGIYLWPILSLLFAVMVFENGSLGYSWDKSFRLIKENWWTTFGALLIMTIIVATVAGIVSVPATLMTLSGAFLGTGSFTIPLLVITTALSALCLGIYVLLGIVVSLSYFSLVEKKEGTGLLDRINSIGTQGSQDLPEEQY